MVFGAVTSSEARWCKSLSPVGLFHNILTVITPFVFQTKFGNVFTLKAGMAAYACNPNSTQEAEAEGLM